MDFLRGAALSNGGKPIIALASTAKDGTISRIVASLQAGAGVTTTRAHVHYVATEYGIVNLHGLDLEERARALISLAHPQFREHLEREARRLCILRPQAFAAPGSAKNSGRIGALEREDPNRYRAACWSRPRSAIS